MSENNKDIPIGSKKKMAAILADSFMEVTIGGVKRKIKPLRTYSKYKILEVMQGITHTEEDIVSVLREATTNIECAARIVAICLCNHLFTEDDEKNEELIEKETKNIMLSTNNEAEWGDVIVKAIESLNVETVFQITALADLMTKSLVGRKGMMERMKSEVS